MVLGASLGRSLGKVLGGADGIVVGFVNSVRVDESIVTLIVRPSGQFLFSLNDSTSMLAMDSSNSFLLNGMIGTGVGLELGASVGESLGMFVGS